MKKIWNWEGNFIYETDNAYLLIPYKDVILARVPIEEFQKAQQEAKGRTRSERKWIEIARTSGSDIE